ncbi:MAG TPA: molybdopterin-binding protein [Xanthobacteraceae bacterium]|jgi:molybdopterin biosynthesis enzyme
MVDADKPQRIERLMPLADAFACIDRRVAPVGTTRPGILTAAAAHPSAAIALRDGVALRAEATLDASSYAPIAVAATPVETGDPLPAGADAVAPIDAIEVRGTAIHVFTPLAPGDGVLPAGGDMPAGEPLGRNARRQRAVDLAVFSILGLTARDAHAPRICVAAANPGDDVVIDATINLLMRAIADTGGIADRADLAGALTHSDSDAIMIVGGSGVGRRDRAVRELAQRGEVVFHGVGVMPGETAAFGMIGARPVLVVPGRLDAGLAVWLTLGRRILMRIAGCDQNEPGRTGVLAQKITSTLGLAEVVPVARDGDKLTPLASGYLPLQALARADGYVLVSADSEGFAAGTRVEVRPLP